MITLRTLGGVGLAGEDGKDLDSLLRQPKRLALLIYLASPYPGTWHRRETLLGVFWPDVDSSRARVALRNSLYVIRQALGAGVIRARGDEEVSLDPAGLASDAADFCRAVTAGDLAAALALHGGDFLPGFYVSDAGEFERWLDGERDRLRAGAIKAASQFSLQREQANDLPGAIDAMRRLVGLDPDNESATRRLIELLDRHGDHGQALAVFERLQLRLRDEFEAEPSPDTAALVNAIRSRRQPRPVAEPITIESSVSAGPDSSAAVPRRRGRARTYLWGVGVACLIAVGAVLTALARPRNAAAAVPTTLLVLPMENATGNPADAYLASGLGDDLARRLASLKSFTIKSAALSDWPARLRDSLALIGSAFGTQVVLRTHLTRSGDSLQVEGEVVDVTTHGAHQVVIDRFVATDMPDAGSRLAAAVAGAVFRVPLPEVPRPSTGRVDAEAYRLTLLGWHRLLLQADPVGAGEAFVQASRRDPMHARAWSGLSSTWSSATVNGRVSFDQGFVLAEAAANRALALDSLQGTAWANLGILTALRERNTAAGERYFARAFAAEPANAESFMVYATMQSQAGQWDRARDAIRVARQLDPLSAYYAGREANYAFCAGRTDEALQLYREQLALDPAGRESNIGVARALAGLGRWSEAIAQLQRYALVRGDSTMARAIMSLHGEAGYWRARGLEGARLLQQRAASGRGWLAPYLVGVAEIGAGNVERGIEILEGELRVRSRMLYKLACSPDVDAARSSPRFQRLLAAAGRLPSGE